MPAANSLNTQRVAQINFICLKSAILKCLTISQKVGLNYHAIISTAVYHEHSIQWKSFRGHCSMDKENWYFEI